MKYISQKAMMSPDEKYRYVLIRTWNTLATDPFGLRYVIFVGLNPSTADATVDDPTIRRCVNYAKAWGFTGMGMLNLFALRATQPSDMMKEIEPVGEFNDKWIKYFTEDAGLVVACWGAHGSFLGRDKVVRAMIPHLNYLRLTKQGHPAHPLYLPGNLEPKEWL